MKTDVNGTSLFFTKTGSGTPLLLLHGNGEDHTIFDALSAQLSPHFTVYAIDSRNHGQSAHSGGYAYETMAGDIHAFIRAHTIAPVHLLGFSDGAIIGILLALRYPEVLRKAALLGPNLQPSDFTNEVRTAVEDEYIASGNPLYRMMLEQPDINCDDLKRIALPVLLVGGEHDCYRPGLFERMAQALPDARLKVMQGHTHDSYIVGQDILAPDLIAFFTAP